MSIIIRRSVTEYRRQITRKDAFLKHSERMAETLNAAPNFKPGVNIDAGERERNLLLLLMPLFEIAWADGTINGYEQDAILQVADIYGLIDHAPSYRQLCSRLGARPQPKECEQFWCDISALCLSLGERERSAVTFNLAEQAEYVAAQSQRWLLGYWKGRRAGERELELLVETSNRLARIKTEAEKQNYIQETINMNEAVFTIRGHENLARLVPLVKVAWADGQVTKRERHLVLEVASKSGINPETDAFKRLESWLELHPTDEFYDESLNLLREHFQKLHPNERNQRKFDLLADCADIAAASGGSSKFAGGGARVSKEEIAVVKRIAKKLNGSKDAGLA